MSPHDGQNGASKAPNDDSETTPLLAADIPPPEHSSATTSPTQTPVQLKDDQPIPYAQILFLCYTSLVEPVAFFSIFPYINFMIERTGGVEKEDVGFYSGLIESLFSAVQMCVMIFWGRAADRFGRKPILVVSLFGVATATALFGLSRSLWQMILLRCLAGIFAGSVVTVRAMLTENSTKNTQARVFSWFAFARNMGILIGPMLGGAFERPALKFPSTIGRVPFFRDYPYALPGFMASSIGFSAALLVIFFVKETLHIDANKDLSDSTPPMSIWELLNYPGVLPVMAIYSHVMVLAFAFTAADPVFLYTPVDLGGLELTPGWMALAMALGGGAQALWLLIVFPWLHKRIGTGGVLKCCAAVWPITFGFQSLVYVLRKYELFALCWTVFVLISALGCGVAMAFTAVQLAVNDIAPSPQTFATLNSIVLAAASGLRAVFPALSTSLYAVGVKYHILWGQLFWLVIVLVAAALWIPLAWLPEKAAGGGRSNTKVTSEAQDGERERTHER